jgi:vacuolar protein sorting-associated protein 26
MFALAQSVANFVQDSISEPWTAEFSFDNALEDGAKRPQVIVAPPDAKEQLCTVYGSTDDIKGKVIITVKEGRVMDHDGITIALIGRVEIQENPEIPDYKSITNFVRLVKDVTPAGRMEAGRHQIDFAFDNVVKEHESYYGRFATIRYLLRMSAARGFRGDFTAEQDLVVQLIDTTFPPIEQNPPIQMDVGVENCIHISFIYAHSHYPVDSILTGKCVCVCVYRISI